MTDVEVVSRVRAGEVDLFEVLMRRHNTRVYRVARAVLRDENEAEDVMQQTYIKAFQHLDQFEDRSQFSTWLTRIAVREALARQRKWQPDIVEPSGEGDHMDRFTAPDTDPERQAYAQELGRMLEHAVDELPEAYRTVFMLRDVEGMSTAETADGLELGEEAVKTRLHRARAMLRRSIATRIGETSASAFQFHAVRCDRVVAAVLSHIRQSVTTPR